MFDIVIQGSSEKPIYEQVYSQIASQILNGLLAPHTCLPSIRTVAREVGVSIITIKKAWEQLEAGGLIYTQVGRGSFVAEQTGGQLDQKKHALALDRFRRDAIYYRELNISKEEFLEIVQSEYDCEDDSLK